MKKLILLVLILLYPTFAWGTFFIEISYDPQNVTDYEVTGYEVFINGDPLCTANPSVEPGFTHDCEPQEVEPGTYDFTVRGVKVGGGFTPTSAPYSYTVIPGIDTPVIIRIRN